VVPNLVVFEVLERSRIEPGDFVVQRAADVRDSLCAVEPGQMCQLWS
jgi:hypothetical protein